MMRDGPLIAPDPAAHLTLARLWLHLHWNRLPSRWLAAQQSGDLKAMRLAELEVVSMASSDPLLGRLHRRVLAEAVGSALRLCREARARVAGRNSHDP